MARRVAFALMLLATSCAEPAPPTLDTASVIDGLPAAIWPSDPALVSQVDCPDLSAEVIAQSSVCEAALDSSPVRVDITVDELGQTSAVLREPLFEVAGVVERLRQELHAGPSAPAPEIECSRQVVVAIVDARLRCTASTGTVSIDLDVVLLDDLGNWAVDYVP